MPWYDTQNKIETIVPGQHRRVSGAPPGWVFPGDKGSPRRSRRLPGTISLAHRFAWAPSASADFLGKLLGGAGRTSIRAAFGLTIRRSRTRFIEEWPRPLRLFWQISSNPMLFGSALPNARRWRFAGARFPFILPCGFRAVKISIGRSFSDFELAGIQDGQQAFRMRSTSTSRSSVDWHQDFSDGGRTSARKGTSCFSHYEPTPATRRFA